MKKLGVIAGLFVIVLLAFTFSKSEKGSERRPAKKIVVIPTGPGVAVNQVTVPASPAAVSPKDEGDFAAKFQHEAQAVGRLDDTPKETEARLREWARSLTEGELRLLGQKALDQNLNGDDRFLAVQLLGWSESGAALPILENVAITPIAAQESRARSGELALRALAIESVGHVGPVGDRVNALLRVSTKVADSFLSDRTQRALAHLRQPGIDTPEAQDAKALSQLTH